MSQHDFEIANQGFPSFRSDLNSGLQALASNSAGATEPSSTYAYQFWYDSTANLLKMRNTDNDAWITLAYFDQTNDEWEVRSAVLQAVDSAGVVIKTDDGTTRLTIADDGSITTQGDFTVGGDLDVSSGTIKLDGNYPVGTDNVALGNNALDDGSLTGANNIAIGSSALTANTSGARNVGVGHSVLSTNTTGNFNTAVGFQTLQDNISGSNNTAVGYAALTANTTATNNTAIGASALTANTTGAENTAVGYQALWSNTTASDNCAFGRNALVFNTTGANNVAVGRGALQSNTTASNNTAVGKDALIANTTGNSNVAVGHQSLDANTTSSGSVAVGFQALTAKTGGFGDVAVGRQALHSLTTGQCNTAVGGSFGGYAGGSLTTGSFNTFIGTDSGHLITTGSANTIIGAYDGNQGGLDIRTSSNNIVLSDGDGNPRMRINSNGGVNIGSGGLTAASTDGDLFVDLGVVVGTMNGDNRIAASSLGGGSATLYIGNAAIQVSSDQRIKTNIADTTMSAVDKINEVRVVDFEWDDPSDTSYNNRNARGQWTGVLAQELVDVFPFAVNAPRNEDDLSIDYESDKKWQVDMAHLVPVLMKAIQEQQAEIESLKERVATLEAN